MPKKAISSQGASAKKSPRPQTNGGNQSVSATTSQRPRPDGGRDHAGREIAAGPRNLGPGCVELQTEAIELYDLRAGVKTKLEHLPVIHVVRGMGKWLPWLADADAAPVVCISDWQYEYATQQHFWHQTLPILHDVCGGEDAFARALMLVAGDMASAGDELRGTSSDTVPDLEPFASSLGQDGAMFFVYGNHDDEVIEPQRNASGVPQLLPDGESVHTNRSSGSCEGGDGTKQPRWKKGSAESCVRLRHGLRIGGVHGIPSSAKVEKGSHWKKRDRGTYFRQVHKVCSDADIVVVHSNPRLPGQEEVEGPDGPALYNAFVQGGAKLLVHGHMHTREVVTVINGRQVVVNSDCRVVVLMPGIQDAATASPEDGAEAAFELSGHSQEMVECVEQCGYSQVSAECAERVLPALDGLETSSVVETATALARDSNSSADVHRKGRWRVGKNV